MTPDELGRPLPRPSSRRQEPQRRWWWTAALIVVPVAVGTVVALTLLLTLVDAGTARDQIELLKTGLAVGAGVGGAVALLLAGRRQWSLEQAHRLTERSVADARHDATERRITDLYSKAADQLGSDKVAVRLAGLYSLERLGQDAPALRQTIVNLLCAYLRMPFTAPLGGPADDVPEGPSADTEYQRRQEREVRVTAQRILLTHLRPDDDDALQPVAKFWPDIDVNLTGAVLYYFDLGGARLRNGAFGGARFLGWTRFDETRFDGDAVFGAARFERSVGFKSADFGGEARFRGAQFMGHARFDGARFRGAALFGGTRSYSFGEQPDGASFADGGSFTDVEFTHPPVFEYVRSDRALPYVPPGWSWRHVPDGVAGRVWTVVADGDTTVSAT